ncbi:MAG: hypothetical protein ACLQBD_11055 [Syntrophobacteraceae bacterium]
MKTVLTTITLFSMPRGGRISPIIPLRDFGCPVFFKNVSALSDHGYECRLLVRGLSKAIQPGETVHDVTIAFLSPEEVMPHIKVGTKFDLWEGGWIGEGEITAIAE